MAAMLWRHENGAKWCAIPAELGPWRMAAQTFIRWSQLCVWERLLTTTQQRSVALGRSRGSFGTEACVIADGAGRAVAFALAPGQAHRTPA